MINANWLPVPGAAVAVLALLALIVAQAGWRRTWAPRLWALASPAFVAGAASLLLGVALGTRLSGLW